MRKKIGRNEPCPCGSGKKFKRCHALVSDAPVERLGLEKRRHEAREVQRQQQQGLRKPIISAEFKGQCFVAAGNVVYSSPRYQSFHDFLLDYSRHVPGDEWWLGELKKPNDQRHPVLKWLDFAQRSRVESDQPRDVPCRRPMSSPPTLRSIITWRVRGFTNV